MAVFLGEARRVGQVLQGSDSPLNYCLLDQRFLMAHPCSERKDRLFVQRNIGNNLQKDRVVATYSENQSNSTHPSSHKWK